jgi:hypothetical protein
VGGRETSVNHAGRAFMQNKRCPAKARTAADVVNQNSSYVYQTDEVFIAY